MEYKNLLLISVLLVQSTSLWAMDANEDVERASISHRLEVAATLLLQAPGSLYLGNVSLESQGILSILPTERN